MRWNDAFDSRVGTSGSASRAESGGSTKFIGNSPAVREVYDVLGKVAPSTASVLVAGESGTGKELVARTLHRMSRRTGAFVAIHCGAIPETLTESELFGHEKGAFTGASERKPGCFELAEGGTLFLDELNAMPTASQAKLLRALEERSFRRLRGTDEIRVNVRLVAAMNEEPEAAVREGRLREDLFYRLNVFKVRLPPLRERPEDVELLAEHFVRSFADANRKPVTGLTAEALAVLRGHEWPGNVRELRNVIERAVILTERSRIGREALPPGLGRRQSWPLQAGMNAARARPGCVADGLDSRQPAEGTTLEEATRWLVLRTLEATDYNKTRAAGMLGVSAKTVYNKLKLWTASGHAEARVAEARCRERWKMGERRRSGLGDVIDDTLRGAAGSFLARA